MCIRVYLFIVYWITNIIRLRWNIEISFLLTLLALKLWFRIGSGFFVLGIGAVLCSVFAASECVILKLQFTLKLIRLSGCVFYLVSIFFLASIISFWIPSFISGNSIGFVNYKFDFLRLFVVYL